MSFADTRQLLKGVADVLAGMTWQPPGEPAPEPQRVFDVVAFYDAPRLQEALQDLLVFEERVALVIPGEETYRVEVRAGKVLAIREMEVDVLLSGKDYDPTDNVPAYFGMIRAGDTAWTVDAEQQGIIGLKDRVVEALTGSTLGMADVCLTPVSGAPFTIASVQGVKSADSGVRKSWMQTFRTRAGISRVAAGNG